jgi:hypothetical protein
MHAFAIKFKLNCWCGISRVRPSQIFATLANFQKTCPRNPLELPEKNGTSKNAPFCGSFLEVMCHPFANRLPECWNGAMVAGHHHGSNTRENRWQMDGTEVATSVALP